MQKMKSTVIPEKQVIEVDQTLCDLCEVIIVKKRFEINQAEVKLSFGSQYPTGGHATETVYDICPTCFKNTLVPFLTEKGATSRQQEIDW